MELKSVLTRTSYQSQNYHTDEFIILTYTHTICIDFEFEYGPKIQNICRDTYSTLRIIIYTYLLATLIILFLYGTQ